MNRHYSFADRLCLGLDQAIRTLSGHVKTSTTPYPAENLEQIPLTKADARQAAALMRVNHTGEICAQALYHSQSLVSRKPCIQEKLQQSAIEEGDHLTWCRKRLEELQSHPSFLNPFWYTGSFCMGLMAGLIGDQWSLGFVAETEKQVVEHLEKHLHLLPKTDQRSFEILKQMEQDEAGHREEAIAMGASELPFFIKKMMQWTSAIMVKVSYWV